MPNVTLANVPWAAGQTVDVYPRRSELRLPDGPPPGVAKETSAIVSAARTLAVTVAAYGEYWACAPLTPGQRDYQYTSFNADVPAPTQIAGPPGPAGVAGPPGPPGLSWRGDWNIAAAYAKGDAVNYGGASWGALTASPPGTIPPSTPAVWALLADKGQQGNSGVISLCTANLTGNHLATQFGTLVVGALILVGNQNAFYTDAGNRVLVRTAGVYQMHVAIYGATAAMEVRGQLNFATGSVPFGIGTIRSVNRTDSAFFGAQRPGALLSWLHEFQANDGFSVTAAADVMPMQGNLVIARLGDVAAP
jgi:hypothetical protein